MVLLGLYIMKKLLSLIISFTLVTAFAQKPTSDKDLFDLFKAKQYLAMEKQNTKTAQNYFFYKAVFYNVCNKPEISVKYLDSLEKKGVPGKLKFDFWELRSDNYVKLFDYKSAGISTKYLIDHFANKFTAEEKLEAKNSYRIWEVLANEPPQKQRPFKPVGMPFTRDLAGLINLKVGINNVEGDFVFDTGAGISCITDVQAEKMGVRILPDNNIEVKGYNGIVNKVRMGIAPLLKIGSIEIENVLFLVFKEEAFTFAEGAYKINGIIGFPIAKDLGTITISKQTISFEKMTTDIPVDEKNLFIELLTPILLLKYGNDLLPFGFDTGADRTDFSKAFYTKYKKDLNKLGKPTTYNEASAGGSSVFKGLKLRSIYLMLGKEDIVLKDPVVNITNYHPLGKELFGNVGQDILKKYNSVVISFDNNYLQLIK
jgi:hypothetical protein